MKATKDFSTSEFDDAKNWITKKRKDKHETWDRIRMACKGNENGLITFLKNQQDDNDWPKEITPEVWRILVNNAESEENKTKALDQAEEMAQLCNPDNEINSRFTVPQLPNSAWQRYVKYLREQDYPEITIQNIQDSSLKIGKVICTNKTTKSLVIGQVQSGKTANMIGLMSMTADWGWNMIIVLTGTIESLRTQNQDRILKSLRLPDCNIKFINIEHPANNKLSPYHLPKLNDLKNAGTVYITVCLKVSKRLQDLRDWLTSDPKHNTKHLRILLIDDECDQASINTADISASEERKKINRLILQIVNCQNDSKQIMNYERMSYVCFSATPYGNILNELDEPSLYPKDLIHVLPVSKAYFGPKQFFGDPENAEDSGLNLVRRIESSDVKAIDMIHNGDSKEIPKSLQKSLAWFLCAAAALRFHKHKKPVSMLIHTSMKQEMHDRIADAVVNWFTNNSLDEILRICETVYQEETNAFTKIDFRDGYPDYFESDDNKIYDYPDFSEISNHISDLVNNRNYIKLNGEDNSYKYGNGIHLCVDNCANNGTDEEDNHLRLSYPDDADLEKLCPAPAFMVIGGNTLSRGLTLQGLVSSYFKRTVKQADSLMQMGRWFGYRKHYELFPRVWLDKEAIERFSILTDIDCDLRKQIAEMANFGNSRPEDLNLAIKTHPKASFLALTAKNKMQSAEPAEISLSGRLIQLTVYPTDKETLKYNKDITKDFIQWLGKGEKSATVPADTIWKGIDIDDIYKGLLERFKISETSRSFQDMKPAIKWAKEKDYRSWNIVLAGNQFKKNDESIWIISDSVSLLKVNRTAVSKNSESVNIKTLTNKIDFIADVTSNQYIDISKGFRQIRKEEELSDTPLLVIYVIDKNSAPSPKHKDRIALNVDEDIVGLAMLIPGDKSKSGTTRLQAALREDDNGDTENEY